MKIKFASMKILVSKVFSKLVLGLSLLSSGPRLSFVCCLPTCTSFAYSVVPGAWILDALLSLGVPKSIAEGNAGSTPCEIHPTDCPFLIKFLTLKSSTAPWLCRDHFLLELSSKKEKPVSPTARYFIATVQHR